MLAIFFMRLLSNVELVYRHLFAYNYTLGSIYILLFQLHITVMLDMYCNFRALAVPVNGQKITTLVRIEWRRENPGIVSIFILGHFTSNSLESHSPFDDAL